MLPYWHLLPANTDQIDRSVVNVAKNDWADVKHTSRSLINVGLQQIKQKNLFVVNMVSNDRKQVLIC